MSPGARLLSGSEQLPDLVRRPVARLDRGVRPIGF
jgi:hypothetical protein